MLVVRREGDTMRRYVHIGTGNYNPKTARIYTDFGILSADPSLGADLTDLFNVLTGFASPTGYRKLIVAPRGMRTRFLEMIRREIGACARRAARADHGQDERAGGPGHHRRRCTRRPRPACRST